jgi:glyoxylase-like metal-dependent hydrolase (beta-lactamase superfamily II)
MIQLGRPFSLGETTITLFDSGLLIFDMAAGLGLPEAAWRGRYDDDFVQPLQVPMQHLLVQTPETTILVDAGSYDIPLDSPMRVPGYAPPPAIPAQLRAVGVQPEQIEHLVITHLHFDHYNGLTERHGGTRMLCYPNATVYVGAGDWQDPVRRAKVQQPETEEYATLGAVARQGQLQTVDSQVALAPGVEIVPMPGETPGHLGLRVASGGQALYCIGDLVHHVVEVEQPEWCVTWADHAGIIASRRRFFPQMADEAALVVASHIPGAGRIVATGDGWCWEAT